ncbi:MAG: hypothetical protein JXL97_18925 [Bacteroidales bacterium]|nr:hypothetical protein [Bacteroidales bacterium]
MIDPIRYLYENYSFEKSQIRELITGLRYLAVLLKNGEIGVCATLSNDFDLSLDDFDKPNLNDFRHRILLNAYYNAIFNTEKNDYKYGDITEIIDFKNIKDLVMIGYFRPVVEKFQKAGINVHIFDLKNKEVTVPMEFQKNYLKKCDAAIVTATTFYNNTFLDITENCSGDIYILGPSTIMHPYIFEFSNVKYLFGSLFERNDNRVLDIIGQDLGTRHFLKLGKKVFLNQE